MKRALLIIFLFGFSIIAKSQIAWCDSGATWYYYHSWFAYSAHLQVKYTNDTTINSLATKKLEMKHYSYNQSTGTYQISAKGDMYTYSSNSIVYLYNFSSNLFDTLCNFNAKIGDKWKTNAVDGSNNCNGIVTVIDTGTSIKQGQPLKWIYTSNNWNPFQFNDTIYERIGYNYWGPFPSDYCRSQVDGHIGGNLLCYSDSNFSTYNQSTSCDFIINSFRENSHSKISFYPNPTSNLLNFENLPINEEVDYSIYSLDGKIIQQGIININQIDISSIENGVYFLKINLEGKSKTYKVVKTD